MEQLSSVIRGDMMGFNNPTLRDENNADQVKRYVHQTLTNEHYGIQYSIKENGHVVLRSKPTPVKGSPDEVEYDEVEIPASLVFKLVTLLKATRTTEYLPLEKR